MSVTLAKLDCFPLLKENVNLYLLKISSISHVLIVQIQLYAMSRREDEMKGKEKSILGLESTPPPIQREKSFDWTLQ
jgi:hypothetical protein